MRHKGLQSARVGAAPLRVVVVVVFVVFFRRHDGHQQQSPHGFQRKRRLGGSAAISVQVDQGRNEAEQARAAVQRNVVNKLGYIQPMAFGCLGNSCGVDCWVLSVIGTKQRSRSHPCKHYNSLTSIPFGNRCKGAIDRDKNRC